MGIKTRGYTDEDRQKGKTSGAGGPFPPEGTYEAKVVDARYVRGESDRGPWEKVELHVELAAGDPNRDPPVRRYSGFTDNAGAMANLMDAIAQRNDPEELEPDDMIGRRCRAVIKHSKPDANGKAWANVAYLLPLSGGDRREAPRQEQRRDDRRDERRGEDRQEQRREPARQEPRGGYRGRQGGMGRTYGGNAPADDSDLPF
jgi:hypothetical protein